MPESENDPFAHLGPVGRAIAAIGQNPRMVVYSAAGALVVTSWTALFAMGAIASRTAPGWDGGPGDWLMRMLPSFQPPPALSAFFALCLGTARFDTTGLLPFLALWLMWFLMALAMMLPSAAPMVRTYCDIAEAACEKKERAAHPAVLVAGYLSVWLMMASVFAGLAMALNVLGATASFASPLGGALAPLVIALSGIYQFTPLRNACLEKCRNPFAVLFGQWSGRAGAIFRLGIRQGIFCVGCCWALMLVMFVVGMTNVFWMVLLCLFTLVEKTRKGTSAAAASGVILLVWAAALMFIRY